jgi:hypothetical protein
MTDIVERLRDEPLFPYEGHSAHYLCREAADELDRLKTALWHAREDMAHLVQQIDAALTPNP